MCVGEYDIPIPFHPTLPRGVKKRRGVFFYTHFAPLCLCVPHLSADRQAQTGGAEERKGADYEYSKSHRTQYLRRWRD
jgi:hypothetical protein